MIDVKKFKYGYIAYKLSNEIPCNIEILHCVLYEDVPTEHDLKHFEEELNTDPEFNLIGRINKDVFIMDATPEMIDFYSKVIPDNAFNTEYESDNK